MAPSRSISRVSDFSASSVSTQQGSLSAASLQGLLASASVPLAVLQAMQSARQACPSSASLSESGCRWRVPPDARRLRQRRRRQQLPLQQPHTPRRRKPRMAQHRVPKYPQQCPSSERHSSPCRSIAASAATPVKLSAWRTQGSCSPHGLARQRWITFWPSGASSSCRRKAVLLQLMTSPYGNFWPFRFTGFIRVASRSNLATLPSITIKRWLAWRAARKLSKWRNSKCAESIVKPF